MPQYIENVTVVTIATGYYRSVRVTTQRITQKMMILPRLIALQTNRLEFGRIFAHAGGHDYIIPLTSYVVHRVIVRRGAHLFFQTQTCIHTPDDLHAQLLSICDLTVERRHRVLCVLLIFVCQSDDDPAFVVTGGRVGNRTTVLEDGLFGAQ